MNLKDIDVVVFDIGNVLLSFKPFEYLRSKYSDEELIHTLSKEIFGSDEWLQLDRGTITQEEAFDKMASRIPELKEYVKDIRDNYFEMFLPISSSVEFLHELKEKGIKLYYLSNFHKKAFEAVYEKYDFFKLFHGGVVSSDYKLLKPEIKIYDILIHRYNFDPRRALFIDDTKENIGMAQDIGFRTIHFGTGVETQE